MAKQKKEEVTLQELITLRNSAQLVLDVVEGIIAELASTLPVELLTTHPEKRLESVPSL